MEKASTKDEALSLAITAVELYIEAVKHASTAQDKARLRVQSERLLSRAEDIKKSGNWRPTKIQPKTLTAPLSQRDLSRTEEIILLEASRLHGFVFPPWTSNPDNSVFEQGSDLYKWVSFVNFSCNCS